MATFALTPHGNLLALDWLLIVAAMPRPAAAYIALHDGDPGDTGINNEVTGAGYARSLATFEAASFANSRATTVNTTDQTFTPNTGVTWTATHVSIWDAVTAGSCIAQAVLFKPILADDATPTVLPAGKLPITLFGGVFTEYSSKALLNFLFNAETVTRPLEWWSALHVGDPGDTGANNEVNAGVDVAYIRKTMTFNAAATVDSIQRITNSGDAEWIPDGAASYTVTARSTWDAVSGGNCLIKGNLYATVESSALALMLASGEDVIDMKL